MQNKRKNNWRRLRDRIFSFLLLAVLAAGMIYAALEIVETYQERPDFGGMVMLRQAEMELDFNGHTVRLSRAMILDYITNRDVLVPIAEKHGWNIPYEEMLESVDVKERMASKRSYIVTVNTMNAKRSQDISRELSRSFLNFYRRDWEVKSRANLGTCEAEIARYEREIAELKDARAVFQNTRELRPINTVVEMEAINNQLVEAQKQFLTAYGAYIAKMEEKRSEFQLEFDLARQIYTDNDVRIRNMRRQLQELDRQCAEIRAKLEAQRPNLYKMTLNPPPMTNMPNDIIYFYNNIQTLQQLKLSLMLDSIIQDKQSALEKEIRKKETLERLLESHSCDVFIREVEL